MDDAAITAMAERILFCHRSTGTLNGKAGSNAEKDLAGKLADDTVSSRLRRLEEVCLGGWRKEARGQRPGI